MGCPLKCRYCLNPKCHESIKEGDDIMMVTPQGLYDLVKIDNIYFQTTGGGVCFGGGEPTMYANFIKEFRQVCDNQRKNQEKVEDSSYNRKKDNIKAL